MKIVFVHHCGGSGGAGTSLYLLISKLVSKHEVHIITQQGEMADKFRSLTNNVYEIKGIPLIFSAENYGIVRTIFVNLKSFIYYKETSKIINVISEIKPDIVHINEIGMFSLAKRVKQELRIPVCMHARTVPNRKYKLLLNYFTLQCNKFVDQLICITQSVAHQYPDIVNKVVVYNPIQCQGNEVNCVNYDSKIFKVLFLANLYRQKGVDETLSAAINLRKNPNIKFVIIGSNIKSEAYFKSLIGRVLNFLDVYPDYERRLKNAIDKYKLKNLTMLGQVKDIETEIKKCHLLIAPMHLNGTPRSVIEAGMHGIPSILSLYHRIDDLVEHGLNGFIINEKNSQELVEGIVSLQQDRTKLKAFGKAAKEKYLRVCDSWSVASQMDEVYLNLLTK